LKGYAFVEYEEEDDAANAIDNMNDAEIYGKVVSVSKLQKQRQGLDRAVW
jgi:peptidyl-prolyl isomerase E (cyclophilin E)